MSEFINTIDKLGDDVVLASIVNGNIEEFKDNVITVINRNSFFKCAELQIVVIPNVTKIDTQAFYDCKNLKCIDTSSLESCDRLYCEALEALILRSSRVCVAINTALLSSTKIAKGLGYVYVPRASIEEYRTESIWGKWANQFRALEDYTVDGTITGELDESKI